MQYITEIVVGFFIVGSLFVFGYQSGQISVLRSDIAESKNSVAMLTQQVAAMGKLLLRGAGGPPERKKEEATGDVP